jgi:predicted pyridoxine 5'-phosphate oxidase superfamily flavin-nucleotide-binding protein
MQTKITPEMMPALQGIVPPTLATVSADGIPNITYISHVQYIDDEHLAISRQFFNKSWKNINENPVFMVAVTCPQTWSIWKITLKYQEEKTEGAIFDEMDMMIQAIATMQGLEGIFKLKSAVICKVESIETLIRDGKIV